MRGKLLSGVLTVVLALSAAAAAAGQQPAQGAAQQPKYSPAEYQDYTAAQSEKNAQQRATLLEAFVAKWPQSELLPYVYQLMVTTYAELRNFPKVMDSADRLLALGEKIDPWSRAQAIFQRCIAYQSAVKPGEVENAKKAIAAAETGAALVPQLQKPEQATPEQWEAAKKQLLTVFHHTAGFASMQMKDWTQAVKHFKEALVSTPNDALTYYRMGVSAVSEPALAQDGFWALARSIALKMQNEGQVRTYLRNQILRYEQPTCDKFIDLQLNELLALAGTAAERPATFSIPSRDQLNKVLEGATIDTIIADLKAGGDKAKLLGIAVCGAEFPELGGKVFEAAGESDPVTLKVFTAGKVEDIEASTEPNVEVKVEGQPAAAKLKKDDQIVYSGTIDGYTPEPFMLHLSKGKVKEDFLPKEEEKAPAKKAPPKKTPNRRPPAKSGR